MAEATADGEDAGTDREDDDGADADEADADGADNEDADDDGDEDNEADADTDEADEDTDAADGADADTAEAGAPRSWRCLRSQRPPGRVTPLVKGGEPSGFGWRRRRSTSSAV